MNSIQLHILKHSYWEHFKEAKELFLILPIDHPKRTKLTLELNKMIKQINNKGV